MNCINIEIPDLKFNLYVRGPDEFVEFIKKSVFEWAKKKKGLECKIEMYEAGLEPVILIPQRDYFKNVAPLLNSPIPKHKRGKKK